MWIGEKTKIKNALENSVRISMRELMRLNGWVYMAFKLLASPVDKTSRPLAVFRRCITKRDALINYIYV